MVQGHLWTECAMVQGSFIYLRWGHRFPKHFTKDKKKLKKLGKTFNPVFQSIREPNLPVKLLCYTCSMCNLHEHANINTFLSFAAQPSKPLRLSPFAVATANSTRYNPINVVMLLTTTANTTFCKTNP